MASDYAYIPASTSVQVATEAGVLTGVYCGGGSPPLDLYDTPNGTTTGTQILHVNAGAADPVMIPLPDVEFKTGLYAVANNAAFTVFYV